VRRDWASGFVPREPRPSIPSAYVLRVESCRRNRSGPGSGLARPARKAVGQRAEWWRGRGNLCPGAPCGAHGGLVGRPRERALCLATVARVATCHCRSVIWSAAADNALVLGLSSPPRPSASGTRGTGGNLFQTPRTSRKPGSPAPDGLAPKGTKMSRVRT